MMKIWKSAISDLKGYIAWISFLLFIGFIILIAYQVVFAGSEGEYAKIHKDPTLNSLIEGRQIPSDYNYYYTGRSQLPYAVIGIATKYRLTSRYWHKIKSKNQVVKKAKNLMPISGDPIFYGKINDSAGKRIGLWISEYPHTIIRFSENEIKVFSPYRPNDNV